MSEEEKLNDYESDPVYYCGTCLSLSIKHEEITDSDYCKDCGGTDIIGPVPFEQWEKLYEKKHNHKYAVKSEDPRKSPIFKLPLGKLMEKVYDSPKWKDIIDGIYQHFPKGLSKADSIVVFFDKLAKENKLESLKMLLYKMKL